MKSESIDITNILCQAKHSVSFIGVIPFRVKWDIVARHWASILNTNEDFNIRILCESDNFVFTKAFITDVKTTGKRYNFNDLKFIRDEVLGLPELLKNHGYANSCPEKERLIIEIMHLPIPVSILKVDDEMYTVPWLIDLGQNVQKVSSFHPWYEDMCHYFDKYFDKEMGGKFADYPKAELLQLFDHDRIPRGIFPRNSFYDTDYSQLVVWAFVFDRRGQLLIHRRSDNANDNQGMWDKSVGGHVDYEKDVDTSRAIGREVVEELFTDELKKQDFKTWNITDEEMIYMGEWRPERRKKYPFQEIGNFKKEWAFFRLKNSEYLYSPRTLKDGKEKGLRVIADVYLFLAGPSLREESLEVLKNSDYKLISLSELKTAMEKARKKEPVPSFEKNNKIPLFSPDLTNIMTGKLREILIEFSNYIQSCMMGH